MKRYHFTDPFIVEGGNKTVKRLLPPISGGYFAVVPFAAYTEQEIEEWKIRR